jgi:hypothetical protein
MRNPSEVIANIQKEQVENSINDVFDALVVNSDKGRLPEEIFKSYFLPYFSGEIPLTNTSVIPDWISVAGSMVSEVDILDNTGNTLFTVPSLFNTNIINRINDDSHNLNEIYTSFEAQKSNIPAVANNFLMNELDNKAKSIVTPTIDSNSETKWNDILKRYGKISSSTSTSSETHDDDLEY